MATTTTPFLGCKISLISKSEIRYEGILYTIDPKESTIALAKVRSYGTEDRSAERQVPPREEIFEYIIFRAGDIKDLIVDDPPATIAPGLADPAIIQAHSTSTSTGATFPSTTFPQMTTNSSISATSGPRSSGAAFNSSNAMSMLSGQMKANSNESRSQNSTPTHSAPNPQPQRPHNRSPDNNTQYSQSVKNIPNKENQRRNTNERQYNQNQNYNRRGSGQQQGSQPQSDYNSGRPQNYYQNHNYSQNRRGDSVSGQQSYRQNQNQHNYRQNQQNYRQNQNHSQPPQSGNRFGGSGGYNRQYNDFNSGRGGGRRPPMQSRPQQQRGSQNRAPNRAPKETLKFETEYDFDKAEQEFKELEEKMTQIKLEVNSSPDHKEEELKPSVVEPNAIDNTPNGDKDSSGGDLDQHYDKGKSFFDTISCEALERERGNVQRIDWKAERKLNSETFGVPLSYRRMGFGRGRGGYNRGYSGGYRRGGDNFGRGGGGDNRRYNGPQRNRN